MRTTDGAGGPETEPMLGRSLKGWSAIPGWIASLTMIALTTFWTYWGIAEMYHEGWWGAWVNRLPYLAPVAVCLVPTLAAFRWPIVGGAVIVAFGIFGGWFFANIAIIFAAMVGIGALFIVHGILLRRSAHPDGGADSSPTRTAETTNSDTEAVDTLNQPRRRQPAASAPGPSPWWRRNLRFVLALGLPFLTTVGVSAANLPIVLTRIDNGDRSAQLIKGNGLTLVWAPEGPGWNYRQPWGGYPSWQAVALYGVEPVGFDDKPGYGRRADRTIFATAADMTATQLCRYLSEDGTEIQDTVQDIWRMPTTDEIVRSLARHGHNAGCRWDGNVPVPVDCEIRPDKESPLWSTDSPAIYYWTADEGGERDGVFVSYNGWVNATYKLGGNPRHSYRCVRDP